MSQQQAYITSIDRNESERVKEELNNALRGHHTRFADYKSIWVLVLYWEDCHAKFKDEARAIGELFALEFNYNVEYYQIPARQSQLQLDQKIGQILLQHGDPDSLIIIHYGGHGDRDNDTRQGRYRRSVWAAQAEGGPLLSWSDIQPKLGSVETDILLLLDCCYSAQATRATTRVLPSNVELLAACAMHLETVLPGPHSFTSALVRELKVAVQSVGYAWMSEIHGRLGAMEAQLAQTPIRFCGLEEKKGTIRLERLSPNSNADFEGRHAAALLTLQISMRDPPTEQALSHIVRWLKVHAPRTVSHVDVENVVITTSRIHDFIFSENSAVQPTTLGKDEMRLAWQKFSNQLQYLQHLLTPSIHLPYHDFREELSASSLQKLNDGLQSLQTAIEREVMASPNLDDKENLLKAIDDTILRDLGFAELLSMRLLARFPDRTAQSTEMEQPGTYLSTSNALSEKLQDIPPTLTRVQLPERGIVLVEYKDYPDYYAKMPHDLEVLEQRVNTLTQLLKTPESKEFRTIKCLQYFHEPKLWRYGLVFQNPSHYLHPISLRQIIQNVGLNRKPSLDQKFLIAQAIGRALLKWHMADWVHQGMAAHNIIFFHDGNHIDFANPYLCGFEYARPLDDRSLLRSAWDFKRSVYCHPSRQGLQSKAFRKEHDIYSFGIVMMELGLWDLVEDCFPSSAVIGKNISSYEVWSKIVGNAKGRLSHYMGNSYSQATLLCLDGRLGRSADGRTPSSLARDFENLVLRRIAFRIN